MSLDTRSPTPRDLWGARLLSPASDSPVVSDAPFPLGGLLAQSTGLRTYEAQLYGGRVTATPLGAPGSNGQTLWQVTARTGDGRNATVNVRLTGQFGAEQLRPGSPTKRQLDAAIAAQAPGGGASAPAAPAAPRTYAARLYGGTVTATPLGAPAANGQTLWQVTARSGDGRTATVNVRLTGQFGAEQLRPDSPTKRQLDAELAAQQAERRAQAGYGAYEARLFGGAISAVPSERDARGNADWTVTWSGREGTFSTRARLAGQFGPDQLVDGSYVKNQIGAQILAARARDIPASVSEASFRNLGMDGASAPIAAELYRSMRDQGHGVAQSWSGVWRAYLDGYASGGPAGGRRSLATTVTNPPPSNLSNIPPAEANAVVAGGGRIVGEPFDARPFGNRASIYQVLNQAGNYELRLRLNDPQQYRQSDFLVFENAGRPIDMSRDYTHRLADGIGPIPNPFRTVGSPLYTALNDTLNQALSQENRAPRTAPAGTPMSDNPLVRFYRGAGGAVRGLTGDSIEFLGRVLPYLPSGNGMGIMPITPQAVQGQALNQQIANQTSARIGDSIRDLNDAIGFAIGVPPDAPEVTFGRIAIGVAEGVEGIFNLGRGALNLVRNSDGVQLAVRNASILNRFRNPSPDELGRVVSFVNGISPDEYAAIPVNLKVAMREGLGANRSAPGVQQALARLDNLDGLSPVAVNPGAGASSAPTPTRPNAPTTAAPGVLAPRPSPNPGALDDFLPTAPARPAVAPNPAPNLAPAGAALGAVPTAPAFNAELGTRFGLPIRQSFEGGVFVARLGDDPAPLITSRRPMTAADFRQGPGRDALEARNPANARVATQTQAPAPADDPLGALAQLRARRLEQWEPDFSDPPPAELSRLARTLESAATSNDPELIWRRDEIEQGLSAIARASGVAPDPLRGVDLDDPVAVSDFIRRRAAEEWDGGLRELPGESLDRLARTLDRAVRARSPELSWNQEAIERGLAAVRAAGGRAFPPVSDASAAPSATDFGLPDREYVYLGEDPRGEPVWRGADGRNVGPFSQEPAGEFANPRPVARRPEPRFPFNPTAPGALALAEPPGPLVPFDPAFAAASAPVAREDLPAPQRERIDEVVSFLRDTLGVDLRLGLNFNLSEPISRLPLTRATAALGIDTVRVLSQNREAILQAAQAGDHRRLLDIFSQAVGVGARLGEAIHEPQVVRYILADLFGARGAGLNSAFQWNASTLERSAERSFLGEASPFVFRPDIRAGAVETPEPGFAVATGRLSWNVTPVAPVPGEPPPVDVFGSSVGPFYRVEVDTPIDKTMFELYTPRISIGPLELPSAEYREELANGLVIPAGALVPREMVEIFDRALGDGAVRIRFQTPYRSDAEGQAAIVDEILNGLDGAPSFLDDLGPLNIEATYQPALRARASAPPGRDVAGFRTIDANFLPLEHFANWLVSLVTNGETRLPYDRAVDGVLDPAARFAPDSLHGWRDKVRIKLNVGPRLRLGDVVSITPALYFVREPRPDLATSLVRSNDAATLTFADSLGAERSVAVPTWLAMMVGRRVAPGQIEASLGVNPLPDGGIVVPQGGTASLRAYLMEQWREGTQEDRAAIAEFMAEHMGGASPAIADNRTLPPAVKDELIRLLHAIADPLVPTPAGRP